MSKNKGGRPKIEIDLKQLEALAGLQCTDEEIAAVLGVSTDTIGRRKQEEDSSFAEVYKRGKEKGKASLRRYQFEAAKKGNVTMMIWLGKQLLGQKDKSALEHSGPDGKPIPTANVNAKITPEMSDKEAARVWAQVVKGI